ncbi:hypothetical protein NDU88_000232 [Pleurodeles waltl]|uniref:Uncharacterized protein n=1 Tax=Pleurodeles waltl TaxID=8319 RepID=A0AAV7LU04_PLEWA|nr:hypothetical protein NDU88_000232 [Pleurodeles waltl]
MFRGVSPPGSWAQLGLQPGTDDRFLPGDVPRGVNVPAAAVRPALQQVGYRPGINEQWAPGGPGLVRGAPARARCAGAAGGPRSALLCWGPRSALLGAPARKTARSPRPLHRPLLSVPPRAPALPPGPRPLLSPPRRTGTIKLGEEAPELRAEVTRRPEADSAERAEVGQTEAEARPRSARARTSPWCHDGRGEPGAAPATAGGGSVT